MAVPLGFKHSPESKEKMKSSHAARPLSPHPMLGKKHTPESLAKMSASLKGRICPMKGKRHSQESIEKMRASHGIGIYNPLTGTHRTEITKQKIRSKRLGHDVSEATKEKISKTIHKRLPEYRNKLVVAWADPEKRKLRILEHNPNWQGGISYGDYCPKFNNDFKERVRSFFNYHCVECGTPQKGICLSVHHVNFNKGSCCDPEAPRLFVPLCAKCHTKTNVNRPYWEQHFTEIINSYYEGKCYFTEQEFEALYHD